MFPVVTECRFDAGGAACTPLHESRREIVELCREKGQALFTFLIESATIITQPDQSQIALLSLPSLLGLALQLQWSPDTVKRYVAVFRAINLLQHYHVRRREVELRIPLGPYAPLTNFTALDDLIRETRKKQQQLAQSIKTRYIARFGYPTQAQAEVVQTTLQEVKAILQDEHLDPLKRQRLQIKLADVLTRLAGKPNHTAMGDPNPQQGDPVALASFAPTHQSERQGDSQSQPGDLTATHLTQHEASSSPQNTIQGDSQPRQGDSQLPSNAQQPHQISSEGDSNAQTVLEQGDSKTVTAADVVADDLFTYNVNYLMNNITLDNAKRKRVAQFLGRILENDTNVFMKYLRLFKDYEPKLIGRAFLCTMVLIHRNHWSVDRPGALFTSQCRVLSGQAPLRDYTLDEVEEWLRTWGNLPYTELLSALAPPPAAKGPSQPASLLASSRQVLPPSPTRGQPGHFGAPNKKKRTYGMHYTGLPSGSKCFNNTGSLEPPPGYKPKV